MVKNHGAGMRLRGKPHHVPVLHHGADRLPLALRGAKSLSLPHAQLGNRIQSPSTLSRCFSLSPATLGPSGGDFSLCFSPALYSTILHPHGRCCSPSSAVVGVSVCQRFHPDSPRLSRERGCQCPASRGGARPGCCPLPGDVQAVGIITLA